MDRPCNFPVLLVLLLLFLFSPPPQIALGLSVKIGVLLPFYTSTKTPSYRGMRHLDALRIAIDNVNADETLLPTTNLLYAMCEMPFFAN